jgi:hypothetical protein
MKQFGGERVVRRDSERSPPLGLKGLRQVVTGTTTGSLPADKWTRVASGVGYYTVRYAARASADGVQYHSYTGFIRLSSGTLPAEVTLRVIGYGAIWLYSSTDTTWSLTALGPQ